MKVVSKLFKNNLLTITLRAFVNITKKGIGLGIIFEIFYEKMIK